jgi:hypothetical protein
LPWAYCPANKLSEFRKSNADILLQISEFIPVLKDPMLGADPDTGHFADTGWHLNEETSRLRTDQLGDAIRQWKVWAADELRLIAANGQHVSDASNP